MLKILFKDLVVHLHRCPDFQYCRAGCRHKCRKNILEIIEGVHRKAVDPGPRDGGKHTLRMGSFQKRIRNPGLLWPLYEPENAASSIVDDNHFEIGWTRCLPERIAIVQERNIATNEPDITVRLLGGKTECSTCTAIDPTHAPIGITFNIPGDGQKQAVPDRRAVARM